MILNLHLPPDYDPQIAAEVPDESAIAQTIESQAWDEITFVVLKVDEQNWFEVSGSLNPDDGLCASFVENGQEYVSDGAPESLAECIELMTSYLRGDDRWRSLIDWN